MKCLLKYFFVLIILGLFQTGCDIREATIVYDVEFPRADSDEAQGGGGGGSGGGSGGGPVTPTNPNGSGASYTVSKTIANVYEDHSDNDSFTIALGKAPTADVYMGVVNPDTTEVSVTPTSVVFGTGNWSTAQTISLIGVEDGIADGNLATNLNVYIDNSTDADYNTGIDNATVVVNSIDSSSVSAITLTTTGGNSVTESSGTTDTFTVALATRPAQNVNVSLTSADTGEVTVSPSSVVFGVGNFSSAQTITLTPVEDGTVDGNQNVNISANATSTDISYNGVGSTTPVTVVDSGISAGITITTTGGNSVTESSGTTDTFTVQLNSAPTSNVTLTLTSADTDEVTVSPSSVVFNTGNFNSAQTITLTAVEDFVVDGNQNVNISVNATSTDISYNALSDNTSVTVVDSGYATPAIITNLSASAGIQLNTLTWSQPSGTDNYTLYWSTSSPVTTSSGNFTISPSSTLTYTHAGLTAGTTYYYRIAANNTHGAAALSNEVSGTPTAYSGPPVCNTTGTLTDNDTDLLVHYAFSNNLNDIAGSGTTGSPYNLSNTGGTIKYAQSCAYGQAAYFDSSTGYLENSNFNRTNIASLDSGNYTIALWVNRDADMIEYASAISSKDTTNSVSTWGDSIQIDVDEIGGNNYMRWNNAPSTGISDQAMITDGTSLTDWSYITAVHYDNNTAQFYRNGVLVGTHTTFPARWYKMKVGINRGGYVGNLGSAWKGYIDEVKVYNRAFDGDDVKNACLLYNNCTGVKPAAPDNLTAAGGSGQNVLTWNATNGTDNYTVYWSTDNSSFTAISPVITGTNHTHTGLSGSTTYYYYVKANNVTGASGESNRANATTAAASGVSVAMSGGSNSVNEAGYGEGVYDWSDLIGNSGDDRAYAVTRDAIGNVYVGVQTTSSLQGSNAGSHDAALVKYNSVGVKQWTRQTGSSAADYVKAVATDSEGNAYIIGDVSNASYDGQSASGDRDVFITKYSSNGTKQWSKQFGTAQNDQAADAVIDNDTLYIIGSTKGTMSGASKTSASATYQDSFITRLDSSGNILGSDQFGVSGTNNTVASDMAFDDSGNYYVAGSTTGALDSESHNGNSKTDMFIRKYNSSNVRQWTKLIGNSTHDQGNGVHLGLSSSGATIYLQDQTGGTINSVSAPTSAIDHLVIHAIRASDRAFEWTKFTSHRANTVRGIGADSSGYIYTLHDSSISPAGYDDDLDGNYQITKFNSSGTEQWARLTGSGDSGFDFPLGMYVTKGGQLYVAGTTQAGVLNSSSTWDYKFHGETSAGGFDAVIFKANGANDYVGRDNITVVLSTAPSATVTVNIAGVSTEFTVEPTQLTFTTSNWNTPQTVYIHAIQDNTTDGNQTENLTITTSSSDSNYNGLSVNTPVTVADQTPIAPSVGIGFDNATVTEGNSGTQTRTLTAYLDQLHSSNVTVNLAYGSGSSCTATSGSSNDFAHSSSTMTISAGQSQATQDVNIYGDTTVEDNETACIDVSSVTNGVEEGTQQARLTILNDEVPPSGTPSLTNAVAATQQVTLSWSTLSGATYYKFYYKQDSTVNYSINVANSSTYDGTFTVSDGSATSYVHAGLSAGRYHYTMVAGNVAGVSAQSNMRDAGLVSNFSTTSCNVDNDTDLLVHYDFAGNANDKVRKYGDGRYDLSVASGGTITFPNSRCTGSTAAYFNAGNGYAYNNSLNDDNESNLFSSGNFTVSVWYYADPDMPNFSSLMSSRYVPETGNDGGNWSWQLDSDGGKLRWRSAIGDTNNKLHTVASSAYPTNSWNHAAFVKHDNGTSQIYMNGSLSKTSLSGSNQRTPLEALKIGTNRREAFPWKGYIDEFKIYERALPASQVRNLYDNDTPTSFTKSITFNTSNGYAKQKDNKYPLEIDASGPTNCRGLAGSSGSSYVSASAGRPFALASVFKASAHSSQGSVLSQTAGSDRNNEYRISLEVTNAEKLRFWFGNDQNYYKWTSKFTLDSNRWYGFYVDYDGCSRSYGNSDQQKNFNRFRVWQVDLSSDTATQLTTYGQNDNSYGTWYMSNTAGNPVAGQFYVGSRYENNDEFQGQIAAVVVTTLKTNGENLPGASEIGLLVSNPLQWLTDYKVGQDFRRPGQTFNRSNFSLNDALGASSTKVWLMGGGTNDQCNSTNCKFRNQVYSGAADYDLETYGISSTFQNNVSVP